MTRWFKGKQEEASAKAETREAGTAVCPHLALAAQWDSPDEIGDQSKATGFRCSSCGERFTPEEATELRRSQSALVQTMATARTELTARYPKPLSLSDGAVIGVRLMGARDQDAILNFTRALPADDLLFLRADITDATVVGQWIANIEAGSNVTLLAEADGHIAGYAALSAEPLRWTRNVPEVRVNIAESYRAKGVGSLLVSELVQIGPSIGARKIAAQMAVAQGGARRMFERLGFKEVAVLPGWVTDRRGLPQDLLIMALDAGEGRA